MECHASDGSRRAELRMTQCDHRTGISDHTNVTPVMHGDLPVASRRDFGKDLVGPPRGDQHWYATCPEGRTSVSWTPVMNNRRTGIISRSPQAQTVSAASGTTPA